MEPRDGPHFDLGTYKKSMTLMEAEQFTGEKFNFDAGQF